MVISSGFSLSFDRLLRYTHGMSTEVLEFYNKASFQSFLVAASVRENVTHEGAYFCGKSARSCFLYAASSLLKDSLDFLLFCCEMFR